MKYTAVIDGERLDIELIRSDAGTVEARVGEESYSLDIQAVEPGVYWVRWKNRSFEISVTPNGETYLVSLNNLRAAVEVIDGRAALRRAAQQGQAGAVELRAPMPGKVVKVLVEEGTAVEVNQGLLVIEAMKMQNEIKSPKSGTIRKIGVKESAAVNAGDLLVIVD